MKWVTISGRHINADQVQAFWWEKDKLRIMFADGEAIFSTADPNKTNYRRLCHALGVVPIEGD